MAFNVTFQQLLNWYKTLHGIAEVLDTQEEVDVVFMNFCKDFDRVTHPKLLQEYQDSPKEYPPHQVVLIISSKLQSK